MYTLIRLIEIKQHSYQLQDYQQIIYFSLHSKSAHCVYRSSNDEVHFSYAL